MGLQSTRVPTLLLLMIFSGRHRFSDIHVLLVVPHAPNFPITLDNLFCFRLNKALRMVLINNLYLIWFNTPYHLINKFNFAASCDKGLYYIVIFEESGHFNNPKWHHEPPNKWACSNSIHPSAYMYFFKSSMDKEYTWNMSYYVKHIHTSTWRHRRHVYITTFHKPN